MTRDGLVPIEAGIGSNPRRQILVLHGGGYRGLFTASVLEQLQKGLNQPILDAFDMIAGTSIGGIIALGLANGIAPGEIREKIEEKGPNLFPDYSCPRPGVRRRHRGHDGAHHDAEAGMSGFQAATSPQFFRNAVRFHFHMTVRSCRAKELAPTAFGTRQQLGRVCYPASPNMKPEIDSGHRAAIRPRPAMRLDNR